MIKIANITSVRRAKIIAKTFRKYFQKRSNVLDIGCGTGIVAKYISKSTGCNVYGCDIDKYLAVKIRFKRMRTASVLPFPRKEFEVSMFNDVLHHIPYAIQEKLIKEALRVSEHVLIFELNPNLLGKTFDFLINKLHHQTMPVLFTYRTQKAWKRLFVKLGCKSEILKVNKPYYYPFNHIAFVVTSR